MDEEKKVVLFIHDGVIEGGFTSDPSIKVVISDFDSDLDDPKKENEFWDKCRQDGLTQFAPELRHFELCG